MRTITKEELDKIIEDHQHWLKEDCKGWENMRAGLSGANLRGADLSGTNLSEANLTDTKGLDEAIIDETTIMDVPVPNNDEECL